MRKMNWDAAFSEDDVAWLRQAGFMSDYQIQQHQAEYSGKMPEQDVSDDELTRSAMDSDARVADPVPGMGDGAPSLIIPASTEDSDDDEDEALDDYDKWTAKELEDEVSARNGMEGTSSVEVVGTGQNGKVLKADMIKGLRLWDSENPGALGD